MSTTEPLSILVVEDNRVNQLVIESMLKKQGHRVTIAENGQIALEVLNSNKFDVILMDIQMPVLDGIETTIAIRKTETASGAHIPIIAVTAHAMKGDKEKYLSVGMDAYVSKPVNKKLLFEEITKLTKK